MAGTTASELAGMPVSRRNVLLAGGALAAGAALAGSVATGAAHASEATSAYPWDVEADVVVIGDGTGAYTALRAQTSGLTTVLLEKTGSCGGSTLFSSSVVWAPANDVMAASGDKDSREEALAYIQAGAGNTYLPALAEAYVDTVNAAVRNITDLAGVEWAYWVGGIDYRPELEGGKTRGRSFICYESGIEPRGWRNLPAFAICDQACVDAYALNGGAQGEPGVSFACYDTLDELAQACGIDAEGLKATVEAFNENAEQGLDPDFGRGQDYFGQNYQRVDMDKEGALRTLAPLATPPFWAAELAPTILGTMGGVKVDEHARALDTDGNVIARLYAHGNCAGHGCGGAFYAGGGGTLGPSLAFGELAAQDFLQLDAWE